MTQKAQIYANIYISVIIVYPLFFDLREFAFFASFVFTPN